MQYEKFYTVAAFDKKMLAKLLIKAKGPDRSMADFARQTGISKSTLSRISNAEITRPLTMDTLESIYNNRCTDADIDMSQLKMANGIMEEETIERGRQYVEKMFGITSQGLSNERHSKNAITTALLDRGVSIRNIQNQNSLNDGVPFNIKVQYDFAFELDEGPHERWFINVVNGSKQLPAGMGNTQMKSSGIFLLDAWAPESLNKVKYSFVFNHKAMLEQFYNTYKNAPLNTAFSLLLIDTESETIVEERWLSGEYESILSKPVVEM